MSWAVVEGMATPSRILAWRIPMDRGVWWAIVHEVAKSRTRLSGEAQHRQAGTLAESVQWVPPREICAVLFGREITAISTTSSVFGKRKSCPAHTEKDYFGGIIFSPTRFLEP